MDVGHMNGRAAPPSAAKPSRRRGRLSPDILLPWEADEARRAEARVRLRARFTAGQRALMGARLVDTAPSLHAGPRSISRSVAAAAVAVHVDCIGAARTLDIHGHPRLVAAVEEGAISLRQAQLIVRTVHRDNHPDAVDAAVAEAQSNRQRRVAGAALLTPKSHTAEAAITRMLQSLEDTVAVVESFRSGLPAASRVCQAQWVSQIDRVVGQLAALRSMVAAPMEEPA